jgi:hypothetical protein
MRTTLLVAAALALVTAAARGEVRTLPTSAFAFEVEVTVPGTQEETFDAATGDISGWWDHTFSGKPKAFYLEPKAGGTFMEIFDDQGNGVRHASVIYCDRPRMIRFEGPLGLSGNAIQMVYTYEFTAVGPDFTKLTLKAQGAGHVEQGWPTVVEGVWKHFLIERFKPYVEAGKQKGKK